jgi:WD40-like Beta Propeller Repeat
VLRIELQPLRAILIPGSNVFGVHSLAVPAHEDKIIISGVRKQHGTEESGIFELNSLSGESRMLAVNDKPKIGSLFPARSAWQYLAVSPDGKRAAAMRERALEVIDLTNGSIRTLSEDLQEGAWSPDGRWLAAIDWKKGRTVLMDATTLVPRRILRESNADWSPDSRYLLGVKKFDLCGPYSGTFEATNIETGKAVTIKSSHCKVNRATSGWVSSKISPERKEAK